ncbi:MAG: NUDIX hydrolase [Actinobacteria bacterium]|nr:NUDIX hydrolase [Actinomycetota bacterium]
MTMTGSDRPLVGVGVAIVRDGKILLIKRRNEPGKGLWAVPGGKVEYGETLRDAAVREVKEETGLDIVVGPLIWSGESISVHGHLVLIDFLGSVLGGELAASDDAEQALWVDVEKANELALTPTMHDLLAELEEARP